MRRTRYVALPVRAWQYIGLLVVSLACLTVGLVSRDKEGRAGSLAGPELEHRAPHEVDACPNSSPFTKMPSCLSLEQSQTRDSRSSQTTTNLRTARHRSVDRVSRDQLQQRRDFRSAERLDNQGRNTRNDLQRSISDSSLRIGAQNRARRVLDGKIRSLNSRLTDDLASQRTIERSTDRRREKTRATNESRGRDTLARSMERQTSTNVRRERANDRLRRVQTPTRDSRLEQDRRSLSRVDRRDVLTSERRERVTRLDRRVNVRSSEPVLKRTENLNRRERTNRIHLTRDGRENRVARAAETSRIDSKDQRTRDLSSDRRSERVARVDSRRTFERRSISVETRNREEVRTGRALAERRAERRLQERRIDRRSADARTDRRLVEQRMDERTKEQRTNRRLAEQRAERRLQERRIDRRSADERTDRRLVEQRMDERTKEQRTNRRLAEQRAERRLQERRIDRRSADERTDRRLVEQRTQERTKEQRTNRRLAEQRASRRTMERSIDRRFREQRVERNTLAERKEIRSDRLEERRTDRRLADQRLGQRSTERRVERRLAEERIDGRDRDNRRSLRERLNTERLQRTASATDIRSNEREKRLTNRIRTEQRNLRGRALIDSRRSRSVDREDTRSNDRLSRSRSIRRDLPEDLASIRENIRSSRLPNNRDSARLSADRRLLAVRENISGRSNNFAPIVVDLLKEGNSMKYAVSFDVIRQALVIGLCTIYGLSIFRGKRSFISNFANQVPRFIVW